MSKKDLISLMKSTYQDKNAKQTILQHGISVWIHFKQLYHFMKSSEQAYQYPIPKWFLEHKDYLLPHIEKNLEDIKKYLIFHDCGKPFCITEDEKGQHFKNHAQISKETYISYLGGGLIGELIGDDMLCHITKPKDFETLLDNPKIEILLCAALAEMHSNAKMFGGFDSDSFKIKLKNYDKLGCRILNAKNKQ